MGFLPRLVQRLPEQLNRLRSRDAVLPVDHEERDPAHAERLGLIDVPADVVGETVPGDGVADGLLVNAEVRAEGDEDRSQIVTVDAMADLDHELWRFWDWPWTS